MELLNLALIALGVAAMAAGYGRADYLPYVDQKAVGVIGAEPQGKRRCLAWSGSRRCTPGCPPTYG